LQTTPGIGGEFLLNILDLFGAIAKSRFGVPIRQFDPASAIT